ncbi:aminoglycoside phosphotransferase family protein [Lentzea sp. NBRC 102530]|uniref:aminoglycoside phosphotransferase family protein n=1 Tax=Lentzea sp. NBRC 102530 TaxID=3032201 RepID=UPI0024A5D969|nr:aminoglycoside phosphotransferase family protein [Lentzea sp. NBRC 102530]GLY54567.1 phosphotransferase [Lentzea sp. NBRC 102530]
MDPTLQDAESYRDRLGLRGDVRRFEDGSLPVFAIGDELVLKLFPPEYHDEAPVEAAVMEALQGKLPTPELHATGLLDDWAYVLMSRLHGEEPETPDVEVSRQVGEMLRTLHAVKAPHVLGPGDWAAFVRRQRAGCVELQRKRGLQDEWLERIPQFLDGVEFGDAQPVLLHTEVMSAHLLWRNGKISGLFDFEPAMRGAFEYEFASAGLFVTKGDRACWRALVEGYGRVPDPRRVMAYALLHVYSNMPVYLRKMPEGDTFEELAERWFGG